jgi:hypothetical protein
MADDVKSPIAGFPMWAQIAAYVGVPAAVAFALIYVLYFQLGGIQKELSEQNARDRDVIQVWIRHLDMDEADARQHDRDWAKTQSCIMSGETSAARAACFSPAR